MMIVGGAREQPSRVLEQAEFLRLVGVDNLVANIDSALTRAEELHSRFAGMGEDVARDLATARL
jgi:hypothetical protein